MDRWRSPECADAQVRSTRSQPMDYTAPTGSPPSRRTTHRSPRDHASATAARPPLTSSPDTGEQEPPSGGADRPRTTRSRLRSPCGRRGLVELTPLWGSQLRLLLNYTPPRTSPPPTTRGLSRSPSRTRRSARRPWQPQDRADQDGGASLGANSRLRVRTVRRSIALVPHMPR